MGRPEIDNLHFRQLSQTECGSLTKPFSTVEVKVAVWDCDSYEIPGPDFWEDLQGNVMCFISKFHWNGKLAKGIDSTFIALIPKIDSPQRLNDFRPISLVGNHYKILANVLGNRLRLVIGSVVSESQTTFMRDMQTLDEVFISNEAVDEARRSKRSSCFLSWISRKPMIRRTWATWMMLYGTCHSLLCGENRLEGVCAWLLSRF
jgi:hypothetical protein